MTIRVPVRGFIMSWREIKLSCLLSSDIIYILIPTLNTSHGQSLSYLVSISQTSQWYAGRWIRCLLPLHIFTCLFRHPGKLSNKGRITFHLLWPVLVLIYKGWVKKTDQVKLCFCDLQLMHHWNLKILVPNPNNTLIIM